MMKLRVSFAGFLAAIILAGVFPATNATTLLLTTDLMEDWGLHGLHPFTSDDTGRSGSGSRANTVRTADPQGGFAAHFLQEDGSEGFHYAIQPVNLPPGTYTMSAWFKPAGRTCAELNASGDVSAAGVRFNLGTGTVQEAYEFGSWGVLGSSITPGPDGWHHCSATFRLSGTEPPCILVLPAQDHASYYRGDSNNGIFVWNVSLNAASDSTEPRTHPPLLKADPASRYFVDPSGKAVFLAGGHTWNTMQDWSGQPALDFDQYLEKLSSDGNNCTRIWQLDLLNWDWIPWGTFGAIAPLPWSRTGPGTASDGQPKLDLNSFNEEYFNRLSNRVAKASAKGIYTKIMLFEGCWVLFTSGNYFAHSPYNAANNINGAASAWTDVYTLNNSTLVALQEKYARKVVDTLNGFDNVIYEIINEPPPASHAWQSHMVNFIKNCEAGKPKQHPVGMSAFYAGHGEEERTNVLLRESPSEWISIFGGHSVRPIYGTNPPVLGPTSLTSTDAFETWNAARLNPFTSEDSGRTRAGSFSGTRRTTDPIGAYTADFIQEDTSTGFHYLMRRAPELPPGDYVISVWLKSAGRRYAELNVSGQSSAAGVRFDLSSGVVTTSYEHGAWAVTARTSSAGSGGWVQCTATFRLAGPEPISILVLPSLESTNYYEGDGTSGVYVWNLSATRPDSKVVFLDTDHVWGIGGDASWVWKAFTRGYNLLYMDPYKTVVRDVGWAWTVDSAAFRAMGDAVTYANRMDLRAATSSTTVSSTGYCIFNPGVEYLAWQPNGTNAFHVDLAPGTYAVEWFDPATRAVQTSTVTAVGGPELLAPPSSNTAGSVLYLKASALAL